jgi:hypothetical protein
MSEKRQAIKVEEVSQQLPYWMREVLMMKAEAMGRREPVSSQPEKT